MFDIKITDNLKEKVEIGKKLAAFFDFDKVAEIRENLKKISSSDICKITVDTEDLVYLTIYDYWVYGTNNNEELFYKFFEKTHEEKKKYLTCLNRFEYLYHIQSRKYADLLENKWDAYELLKPYYKRDVIRIQDESDYDKFCEYVEKHPTFVVKPVDLSLAYGVHKETILPEIDKKQFFNSLLQEGKRNKELKYAAKTSDIILEEVIKQCKEMEKVHAASVNGVRITTIRTGNEVHIFYPWLKVGMNGAFVTCVNEGTVLAGIDAKTGIINTNAKGEYLQEIDTHPISGLHFKGFAIPEWNDLVDMVTEMALGLENINYVGWDMVHTPTGWCVMEGNWGGEFLGQLLQDKPLKEEFEEIIGWKSSKSFWWKRK